MREVSAWVELLYGVALFFRPYNIPIRDRCDRCDEFDGQYLCVYDSTPNTHTLFFAPLPIGVLRYEPWQTTW
jgi:hypothetical protein